MSQSIMTIDGPGVVREIEASRSGMSYRVSGNGFEGWYASHEILSELDEDETTTQIPFTNDGDDDADTMVVPHDDPHATDGVTLPWDPEPTDEWDGQLTQDPDGAEISLDPTKSTKGGDFSDDDEVNRVFGKLSAISWNSRGTQGVTPSGHQIDVDDSHPQKIAWTISDGKGNLVHEGEHRAFGSQLEDEDYDHAQNLMEDDARGLAKKHASITREAYRKYEALLDSDSMVREAAWSDVRAKASRLFREGAVTVKRVTQREIFASVVGDHGTYDTNVNRKNAFGQGVTWWNCDCEWGKHAYLRQRTFIGRMCSHAFATYTAMQAKVVPANNNRRIDNKTERHTLGSAQYPGMDQVDEFSYQPRESLAQRSGGLMVWDDDLAKVMKQIYNQQPPTTPGDPAAAPGGLGAPGDMGAPGASPMSADPSAGGAPVDPATGMPADPSMGGGDPSMGDPNGAGLPPAGATPSFVRQNTGPTQPDPTQGQVTSSYPTRRTVRHQFAEFTDGNPAHNFEEWGDPNAEDDTFNTAKDLGEDNTVDPDGPAEDDLWGKHSSYQEDDDSEGEDRDEHRTWKHTDEYDDDSEGESEDSLHDGHDHDHRYHYVRVNSAVAVGDPQPGADVNEPVPGEQLPQVPRQIQQQPPMQQTSGLEWLLADNDSGDSWQKHPDTAQQADDSEDYDDGDANYSSNDESFSGKGGRTAALASWFMDDGNMKEAERFNDDSDEIVREFQRSAAARQIVGGRNFSFSEQQDLIDEQGTASQLGRLNLANSFYEEQ